MMDGNPLFTNINSDGSVASPSNNFIGDPEIGSTLYYAVTADINGVSVNQQIAVEVTPTGDLSFTMQAWDPRYWGA